MAGDSLADLVGVKERPARKRGTSRRQSDKDSWSHVQKSDNELPRAAVASDAVGQVGDESTTSMVQDSSQMTKERRRRKHHRATAPELQEGAAQQEHSTTQGL